MVNATHVSKLSINWSAPAELPDFQLQDAQTQKLTREVARRLGHLRPIEQLIMHLFKRDKPQMVPLVTHLTINLTEAEAHPAPYPCHTSASMVVDIPFNRASFLALPDTDEGYGCFQCDVVERAAEILTQVRDAPVAQLREAASELRAANFVYVFLAKRNKIARYKFIAGIEIRMAPTGSVFDFVAYRSDGSVFRRLWTPGDEGVPPAIGGKLGGVQFTIDGDTFRIAREMRLPLESRYEWPLAEVLG